MSRLIQSINVWGITPTARLQEIRKTLEAAENGKLSSEEAQQALGAARQALANLRDDLARSSSGRRPSFQMSRAVQEELERAIFRRFLEFRGNADRFQHRIDKLDPSQVLSERDQNELGKLSKQCCQNTRSLLFLLVAWANSSEELANSEFLSLFIMLYGEVTVFDRASYGTNSAVDEARQISNKAEVPQLVLQMVEVSRVLYPKIR